MIMMPHSSPSHRCSSQARQTSGTPQGTAYAAGKQLGAERYGGGAQPSWGNQVGNGGGTSNGDGGNEFATKEDVSGIHSRLDEIQGGMQPGGGAQPVQNRMEAFGQGTGSQPAPQAQGTQRSGADILAGYHQQTLDNLAYSQGLHEQVSGSQASLRQRAANWAARSPQGFTPSATGNGMSAGTSPTSMTPSLSGNAMSSNQGSATMNGLVSGGNAGGLGMSENTFNAKKWAAQ